MSIPSDLDLWRSASIVIRQHGSRAPEEARNRADRLRQSGDQDGAETWWRISLKCEELLRREDSTETEPSDP